MVLLQSFLSKMIKGFEVKSGLYIYIKYIFNTQGLIYCLIVFYLVISLAILLYLSRFPSQRGT